MGEQMKTKVKCPHCKKVLAVGQTASGKQVKCPSCAQTFKLPQIKQQAPAPVAELVFEEPPQQSQEHHAESEVMSMKPAANAFIVPFIIGLFLCFFYLIGLVVFIWIWATIKSTHYRLTTERLVIRRGLLSRHIDELELYRIKDVRMKQDVIGRLLHYGTVEVISTDASTPRLILSNITTPESVKETIRSNYRTARKREGVRAGEFIHS